VTEPWTTLVALAIVTAILPVQVAVTVLLLRSPGGRAKAAGWIGGMTVVRLVQYLVLGGVLDAAIDDQAEAGPSAVEGALLLVVAVLLLVSAARKAANQPDDDTPPPGWMTKTASMTPGRAFLLGAGVVALSPKLWALTLGAIGAIAEAGQGGAAGWAVFVAWTIGAQALHLAALLAAVVAPARSDALLERAGGALERYNRPVMIALGTVFGAWFLAKALTAFGVLG
jgi:hypothetical protein